MAKGSKTGSRSGRCASASGRGATDERLLILVGLFVFLLAVFLLVAFTSYLFTWRADQSLSWQSLLQPFSLTAENLMGPIGASLSHIFVSQGFGLAAFVLPVLTALLSARVLRFHIPRLGKRIALLLVGMLLGSAVLGFAGREAGGFLQYGPGGAYGLYLTRLLNSYISDAGTLLLLVFCSLTYLLWMSKRFSQYFQERLRHLTLRPRRAPAPPATENTSRPETTPDDTPSGGDGLGRSGILRSVRLDGPEPPLDPEPAPAPETKAQPEPEAPAEQEETPSLSQPPEPQPTSSTHDFEIDRPGDETPIAPAPTPGAEAPTPSIETTPGPDFTVEKLEDEVLEGDHIGLDEPYDPTLELSRYQMPPLSLLERHDSDTGQVDEDEVVENKNRIVETLANYGISITRIKATIGPTVTLYEIIPAPGVRISKIRNLEDDIALSLSALGIRIIAPIPGKGTIGIEVPNARPSVVSLLSVLQSRRFQENHYALPIGLGKTISNESYVVDLAKMPHLLVAGATGQGKSVGLNAIIASLLYSKHPSQLKFVMVDPKKVELTLYAKIERHYLAKLPDSEEAILTDTEKVIHTLNSLCIEMDTRYGLLNKAEVRNIKEYNEKFIHRRLSPTHGHRYLPYIVLVIDEFADLIMTAGREIELPLARLAQLARAIGIHLVIATQRPTTNIITGLIKANFPARIAFKVTSGIDSKTILDSSGANQLIGRGDMLILAENEMVRVQCAYLDTPEVARITDFIGNQPGYPSAMALPEYSPEGPGQADSTSLGDLDSLFHEVASTVVEEQRCSTSTIQRRFSIGFNRAGRIVDQLEAAGIVGPQESSKPRQVLVADPIALERILEQL